MRLSRRTAGVEISPLSLCHADNDSGEVGLVWNPGQFGLGAARGERLPRFLGRPGCLGLLGTGRGTLCDASGAERGEEYAEYAGVMLARGWGRVVQVLERGVGV